MLESGALRRRNFWPTMHPHARRQYVRPLAGITLVVLLSGCQSAPRVGAADAGPAMPPAAVPGEPVTTSTWSADTLADLLVGEVAGQRGQLDVALQAYLRQAQLRRDPELAARATRIAWFARRDAEAKAASSLWAELAPNDAEAAANAVMGRIQAGEIEAAGPLLDRLLTDKRQPVRFSYLIQYAREAEPGVRARVAALLTSLSVDHPQHARLWLARAALAELEGNPAEALTLVRRARELDPDHAATLESEGRLLLANGDAEAAHRQLQAAVKRFPRERDLRLTYLRALLDTNRGEDARQELGEMLKLWPDDRDLALSLALVEWETGAADAARARMVELAETGYREDEAWMYAGRIALSQQRLGDAATFFQNVRGPMFIQAQVQVAYAWQRLGRLNDALELVGNLRRQAPESATLLYVAESEILWRGQQAEASLAVLDQALAATPDDKDLRYARAMAAERVGRLDVIESDLRLLLAAAPDNAMLLNALGYTLADRTDRQQEARELIERAIALSPEDPAIVDSMGWVNYRSGNLKEALHWLRRAYSLSADGEIAAHLGEVLWMSGKRREARDVWKRALTRDPENAVLRRTLQRLDP